MDENYSDTKCILEPDIFMSKDDSNDHHGLGIDDSGDEGGTIASFATSKLVFHPGSINDDVNSDRSGDGRNEVIHAVNGGESSSIGIKGKSKERTDSNDSSAGKSNDSLEKNNNNNNNDEKSKQFEIVNIPDENEMDLVENAVEDFYRDDQILDNPDIEKSSYKYPLIFSGLIGSRTSRNATTKEGSTCNISKLFTYRLFIFVFIVFVWLFKFDGLLRLKLVVLEKKFPFTVINNLIWELRWVLTYFLCLRMVSNCGLHNFLSHLKITRKQWRKNRKTMQAYIAVVSLITIIIPVGMIILDVNWLNLNRIDDMSPAVWQNVLVALCILLYRLIMTPSFCVLSAMLYLLGDHVKTVGKKLYRQKTFKEAHTVVQKMRKLIRDTEKSLQLIIVIHMLLVFCTSFTTAMSTLERLEFTYSSQSSGNSTMVKIKIVENPSGVLAKPLPMSELIVLKGQLNEMKSHLDHLSFNRKGSERINSGVLNSGVNRIRAKQIRSHRVTEDDSNELSQEEDDDPGTDRDNREKQNKNNLTSTTNSTIKDLSQTALNADDMQKAYQLITDMHRQQIELMEKMMLHENQQNQQNRTVEATATNVDQPQSISKVLSTISDNYNKIKTLIDMVMMLVEVLLLYMAPLWLIIRTDYELREVIHKTWDINIEDQIEQGLAITTTIMKEHILAHVKDTEGFRVFGYRVEFFKALLLASFGPFLAIALRATLKHYGF